MVIDMEDNTFKRTLFGGFRRDDVIAYIEKSSAGFIQRINELEKKEKTLSDEGEALRAENYEIQNSLKASLDALSGELDELRARLALVTGERDELLAEAEVLRRQAEEFRTVKSNLADMELAAHRRANEYEAESRRRVDAYSAETQARILDMVGSCRRQCDTVMETLDATCRSLSAQLRASDETIARLPDAFLTLRGELDELGKLGKPEP